MTEVVQPPPIVTPEPPVAAPVVTPPPPTPTTATPNSNPPSTVLGSQPDATKAEGTPAEAKPGEVKPAVPEKYDLKLPEGSLLDSAYVEKISSEYKTKGLTNEQAQTVLERESKAVSEYVEAVKPGGQRWVAQESEWRSKALIDPEIGGTPEKLQEAANYGNRALTAFFSPEIQEFLRVTGFGSHPELVRGFAKIGRAMGDDKLVVGKQGDATTKSVAQQLYGNTK